MITGAATLCATLVLTACEHESEEQTVVQESPELASEWQTFVEEFVETFFVAHPGFAVNMGRHEFDGQLPDWSAEGIAAEIARLQTFRNRALDIDADTLDDGQTFEREYLISRIDRDLFWLKDAEWPFRNPAFYSDWLLDSLDPNVYVARNYASVEERMQAFIKYANALPIAAQQIKSNLRMPMPRTYIDFGVASFGGLATYFETDVKLAFATVDNAELQSIFDDASARATNAMRELAEWLESHRDEATEDFALGGELFSKMLRSTESVYVTLERLEAVGRADLERNLQALTQACNEFASGKTIDVCVAKVGANKPKGGAVEGARNQLGDLREFLVQNALVSIPGTEVALVEEAPPYNRSNFAYIDIPGPYESGLPSIYYIAPPDSSWSEADKAAYIPGQADLLFTSVHEIWPGHFLNFLHANRSDTRFGQVFVGYAFAEGWAHYSEEMMWEAGLGDGDPEIHIGQLLNALLRNVRFLSAIGLHTQGMSVVESEKMFREMAYQDPGNARQQAARGTYDPAYLNYTMGKLMIRKLRSDWTASRGQRDSWREFHDSFLSYGGPTIPLVRRAMLGDDDGELF